MCFNKTIASLAILVALAATGRSRAVDQTVDLAGEWRFVLDPQDHGLSAGPETWNFPDTIRLPGSTAAQAKGQALEIELNLRKPAMQHLHQKFPYVGPAWYQRTVTIPSNWKDHDIILTLERVLWESRVWVDGREAGQPQNSLSTPHRYNLSGSLTPGKQHTITLRIDNRQQVDIGTIGHAYTQETQSIWNGVIGDLKLEAFPHLRTTHLGIRTLPQRGGVQLDLEFYNWVAPTDATLHIGIRMAGKDSPLQVHKESLNLQLGTTRKEILLKDLPKNLAEWSESSPTTHEIVVVLAAGNSRHVLSKNFGLRSFETKGRDLLINGEKTFLRGNLECAIFPQTGHPDAEGTQWEKIMRTSKDYGLNHLRFHSWCPPEAAFAAADRHGIYLQVELPNWTFKMGQNPPVDAYFLAEGERILREFGHHPSFVMFSLGNELTGDLPAMDQLVEKLRAFAPRLLFTSTSYSFSPRGSLPGPNDDFFISQQTKSGWVRGQGFLNSTFPSTDTDYAAGLECLELPLVTHEVGQYVVYPDLSTLPKYDKTPMRATALEAIRADLLDKGLLEDAARFTRDSGKLAALLYKEDIERALRTKDLAGIQLLQLQDFPGQSTATVGLLDAFWDSKGAITPEEFRQFSSPIVPLVRMKKFVWENTETLTAAFELANFSEKNLITGFRATLTAPDGQTFAATEFGAREYPVGNGQPIGRFEAPLAGFKEPVRLNLTIESADGTARNSWPVWIYPRETPAAEVITHHALTDACLADLQAGRSVLLLPKGNAIINPVAARFIPVFWSPLHFPNQPGTLGATIDTGHPVWRNFPTDSHTHWQWWELTANSKAVDLTGFDPAIAKPFRFIDKYDRNALPAAIFEAKVGEGSLLVCTLDVSSEPEKRIVARQLHRALEHYAASADFAPAASITLDQLQSLFRESGISATAASSHPDYPADFAVDGDPATFWHSDWRDAKARLPLTLTLDLQQATALAGLRLQNRSDNRNGRIKDFTVEVSLDGKRWRQAGRSSLSDSPTVGTVEFRDSIKVRFVRVTAVSSHTGEPLASLAEVEPIPVNPDDVRDLGIIPGFND